MSTNLDTSQIKQWRSIVTLVVFVLTNLVVLFPFHIPIPVPLFVWRGIRYLFTKLRIVEPRLRSRNRALEGDQDAPKRRRKLPDYFVQFNFPMDFATGPLIADLFLLAISAIGREEVHDGTVGSNGIAPIDIMVFFFTLAYIAISIDASGLIRWLAFKVLEKGGKYGHRLFLYLYMFFFTLTAFIGNDPVILSGTAFLAYMTRVSSNIMHPRAWIHTQFAVANIASAILVSSNPTNLVLAGAFEIKFINYTANIIVPVIVTGIVLFPFLLYIVFAHEDLIPSEIRMHELSDEQRARKIVNPNIPNARGAIEEEGRDSQDSDDEPQIALEEILRPFLDKGGAGFGALVMATTLITVLALNASSQSGHEHPVFWVTLPAAVVMFAWDLSFGWKHRKETREIAEQGRLDIERAQKARAERRARKQSIVDGTFVVGGDGADLMAAYGAIEADPRGEIEEDAAASAATSEKKLTAGSSHEKQSSSSHEKSPQQQQSPEIAANDSPVTTSSDLEKQRPSQSSKNSLESLLKSSYRWSQITFPTVTTVFTHLPFKLVPFSLCMFVLVQGLVTTGWVPVFAYGWDHWVNKTGTVGAIGGMGFISVILCNFAGTNIGTAILLSRVLQAWQQIHHDNGKPISDRTFWGSIYAMALGVNYGAFSVAFSASLAGLLWKDILSRKFISVGRLEFARNNLPIIAVAMSVGCAVLVGEVYVVRVNEPYDR